MYVYFYINGVLLMLYDEFFEYVGFVDVDSGVFCGLILYLQVDNVDWWFDCVVVVGVIVVMLVEDMFWGD